MPDTSWLDDEITVTNTGTTERRDTDEEFSTIDVLDLKTVKLGRQGENNTQQVVIDCSEWLTDLPGCQLMVVARRPGEGELYVPQVTASNGVITWPILSQDTALAGWGRAEVRGLLNGKIRKSCVFKTRIEPSLDGDGTPTPPTPPDWATEVINSVAVSTELVEQAEELVEEATATAIYAVRYDTNQSLTDAQKATARGNAGAASDDDLIELENTMDIALAGKVDVAQGAAQAGKALVVGDDGNVTTGEAGIPEAVKTALLNLLEHVAYADGQGQSLYEALVAAFGEDFYDTWVWKLSDEQFEVGVNSAGYDDATHSIFIGNSASVVAIRRHIRVGKGRKPFTDSIGGEDTIYYPIPIPPRASRAKVTITPSIQFSANICKLSGDIWTRSLDTGWKPHQGVFNFDAGENQALIIGMRADANNSAFTSATEPTEIVIEFAIEDYYDSWHWEMADGHTTVNQRGVGLDTTTHRLFITASNASIRRFVAVNRGNVPYYDAGSGSESAFYPIPVPPTAQKMTVNVTPSTIQGQACVMKREGEAYSSHKWMEWSNFPLVSTFTPGENLELMIQLRANSSNANFTTATEPTALTVDFE